MLPLSPLPTDTISINGTDVTYRSLSRREVITLSSFDKDPNAAESFLLSKSLGITEEEAVAWLDGVDAMTAESLLNAIAVLSGIRKGKRPNA